MPQGSKEEANPEAEVKSEEKKVEAGPNQFRVVIQGRIADIGQVAALEDIADVVNHAQQKIQVEEPKVWQNCQGPNEENHSRLHVTIFRSKLAVAYHQKQPFLDMLKSECAKIDSPTITLDELKVFENFERNREFLVLTEKPLGSDESALKELKEKLMPIVDKFCIKLTEERESPTSEMHCSLMYRDKSPEKWLSETDTPKELTQIKRLVNRRLGEIPFIRQLIHILDVVIGDEVHTICLSDDQCSYN